MVHPTTVIDRTREASTKNQTKDLKVEEAAKILNIGEKKLFKLLRANGIFLGKWAKPEFIHKGYFVEDQRSHTLPSGAPHTYFVSLVTPTGMSFLKELIDASDITTLDKNNKRSVDDSTGLQSDNAHTPGKVHPPGMGTEQEKNHAVSRVQSSN